MSVRRLSRLLQLVQVSALRALRLRKANHFGCSDGEKLGTLLRQREGWFLVSFDNHCVAWDAGQGVVHDPDPAHPRPVPLTPQGLALLSIRDINGIYRVERLDLDQQKSAKSRRKEASWKLNS